MNIYNFLILLKEIYYNKDINLKKIQNLGLLAVKIGQTHALRIDLLPEEKCFKLSKLYRAATAIPKENIDKIIKKYGNYELKKVKIDFSNPLAVASIGQVYKGVYKNKKVVVKIIKQDFKKKFIKDVKSVRKIVSFASFFYPKLNKVFDPQGILDHIESYTLHELNLLSEIKGSNELKEIIDNNKNKYNLKGIKFPKYYKELSNEYILVSEFINYPTIDELLEQKKLKYTTLLELFRIHGFYMFIAGKFHGDLHPGNIIVKNNDFYFIDNGSNAIVEEKIRIGLFNFFDNLSKYDYINCAKSLHSMSVKKLNEKEYNMFEKKFIILYKDFKNATVSKVSLTKRMMETIKLGVHSGMSFEKGMFAVIKSLMYLDGMVLRCNPDAILLKDMKPFVKEMKKQIGDNL
jgi:ubiquinone biosynthesis protein